MLFSVVLKKSRPAISGVNMAIRIGILGYGNLGRGVELAVSKNEDMELAGIFTRRDPSTVKTQFEGTSVRSAKELEDGKADDIGVLVWQSGEIEDTSGDSEACAGVCVAGGLCTEHPGATSVREKGDKSTGDCLQTGHGDGPFDAAFESDHCVPERARTGVCGAELQGGWVAGDVPDSAGDEDPPGDPDRLHLRVYAERL